MPPRRILLPVLLALACFARPLPPAAGQQASARNSAEQGRTSLRDSFSGEYEEAVRKAEENATQFRYHFRSFYLSRDEFDGSRKEAWAAGGWIGAKTSYLADRFAFGVTGYTSQHLQGDPTEDGTGLLGPGQSGYDVLGELYTDIKLTDTLHFYGGRKEYDTPYLNRSDSRMTPNTFEAVSVIGIHPVGTGGGRLRYGTGYFHRIKTNNADDFVSMSKAAGASVDRGTVAVGGIYESDDFSIGAIDYLSPDIVNILHAEMKVTLPVSPDWRPRVTFQYSDQRSHGDELLTGGEFEAHQFGIKAEAPAGPLFLTAAWTRAGGDRDLISPWAGHPGFTGVQYSDYNRAGEEALLFRAAYEFESVPGLSAYALQVIGSAPDAATSSRWDEGNLNLEWAPPESWLSDLSLRLRYAHVEEKGPVRRDLEDFRVILNYGREW